MSGDMAIPLTYCRMGRMRGGREYWEGLGAMEVWLFWIFTCCRGKSRFAARHINQDKDVEVASA